MAEEPKADERRFWESILRAVHTRPRPLRQLSGVSGLTHEVIAVGVDDAAKRLVVVSTEHDGRAAALVQSDIQAAHTEFRVLTIRPAVVSVPKLARALQSLSGSRFLTESQITVINKNPSAVQNAVEQMLATGIQERVSLGLLPQILELIQQLAKLNVTKSDVSGTTTDGRFRIDLSEILAYHPIEMDRSVGVCGFPFYDFSEDTIDAITAAISPDDVAQALHQRDILQV